MTTIVERLQCRLRDFDTDTRGVVAILFAVLAIPFFGVASIALDYGRALKIRSSIQTAADAATSAGAQRLGQGRDAIFSAIRAGMDANLPETLQGMSFEYQILGENEGVAVQVETAVPTTLARILGHEKFDLRVESSALRPRMSVSQSAAPAGGPALPRPARSEAEQRQAAEEVARRLQDMMRRGGPSSGEIEELRQILKR